MYYSPKANLDNSNLMAHLFLMCLAKWQTQYNLTENTTTISTRALLLVLENIKLNVELNTKYHSMIKMKGAEGKGKMESNDSCIPKKAHKGLLHWTDKHYKLCKKHAGPHKSHITHECHHFNKDSTPIKKNGAQ